MNAASASLAVGASSGNTRRCKGRFRGSAFGGGIDGASDVAFVPTPPAGEVGIANLHKVIDSLPSNRFGVDVDNPCGWIRQFLLALNIATDLPNGLNDQGPSLM